GWSGWTGKISGGIGNVGGLINSSINGSSSVGILFGGGGGAAFTDIYTKRLYQFSQPSNKLNQINCKGK
ncbi:MAG: hypothetical protein ACYCPQ_09800, partial [Elusimicrobiota bacterium]